MLSGEAEARSVPVATTEGYADGDANVPIGDDSVGVADAEAVPGEHPTSAAPRSTRATDVLMRCPITIGPSLITDDTPARAAWFLAAALRNVTDLDGCGAS
jgi:hypothetical protein